MRIKDVKTLDELNEYVRNSRSWNGALIALKHKFDVLKEFSPTLQNCPFCIVNNNGRCKNCPVDDLCTGYMHCFGIGSLEEYWEENRQAVIDAVKNWEDPIEKRNT